MWIQWLSASENNCDASAGLLSLDYPQKPLPTPPAPGKTEAERFDNAVRKALTVSKKGGRTAQSRMAAGTWLRDGPEEIAPFLLVISPLFPLLQQVERKFQSVFVG